MTRVTASALVPGPVGAVRTLWYDVKRWPSFVDGFGRLVRLEAPWPDGGRIVWDSRPRGRGRVVEQPTVEGVARVEDARLTGTQSVRFDSGPEGDVLVTLSLDYRLKDRTPVTPLVDLLFVRRTMADSLRRTLDRFAIERDADADG